MTIASLNEFNFLFSAHALFYLMKKHKVEDCFSENTLIFKKKKKKEVDYTFNNSQKITLSVNQ